MLGFRPINKEKKRKPAALTRRRSSGSPLPIIYEDRSKTSSRSNDGSSSSSATLTDTDNENDRHDGSHGLQSGGNEVDIVWPPLESPSWPPHDDEEEVTRWNSYGALDSSNSHNYLVIRGSGSGGVSEAPSPSNKCWICTDGGEQKERGYQWMDSDVTEVHSNRGGDRHHDFGSYQRDVDRHDHNNSSGSGGHNNSNSGSSEWPSFNSSLNSSFHRRQSNPLMIRIWHGLSVLVMIVFCSSLFLMPSVMERANDGRWGGVRHGEYPHHGDNGVTGEHGGGREGHDKQWYPKPWKYLFGMGNDEDDSINATVANVTEDASTVTASETESQYNDESQDNYQEEIMSSLQNITFSSLATIMVPHYLQTTIELCKSTIVPFHPPDLGQTKSKSQKLGKTDLQAKTTHISPDSVFVLRKQLLKTRDLLDVFSSVYPDKETDGHEGDTEFEMYDVTFARDKFDLMLEGDRKHGGRGGKHDLSRDGDSLGLLNKDLGEEAGSYALFGSEHKKHSHDKHHHRHHYKLKKAKSNKSHHTHLDLWKSTRSHLNNGYTVIGQFQDLDHASIEYTQDTLETYQQQVWNWYVDFMKFVERDYLVVMRYFSRPCPEGSVADDDDDSGSNDDANDANDAKHNKHHKSKSAKHSKSHAIKHKCQYTHTHSSHLFWGATPTNQLPDGSSTLAHVALARLGVQQLTHAKEYLDHVLTKDHLISKAEVDAPIEKESTREVTKHSSHRKDKAHTHHQEEEYTPIQEQDEIETHETYHNLRKELRSFLDEVDLFGTLMLPDAMVRSELVSLGLSYEELVDFGLDGAAGGGDAVDGAKDEQMENVQVNVSQVNVSAIVDIGPQLSPPVDDQDRAPPRPIEAPQDAETPQVAEEPQQVPSQDQTAPPPESQQVPPPVDQTPPQPESQQAPPQADQPVPPPPPTSLQTTKQKTFTALTALRQTRKLLGDLNDDYTAYTTYIAWNTNQGDQLRLISKIETEWNNFKWWAGQIDLGGQIDFLRERLVEVQDGLEKDVEVDGGRIDGANLQNEVVDEGKEEGAKVKNDGIEDYVSPKPEEDDSATNNSNEIQSQEKADAEVNPGNLDTFLIHRKQHPTHRIVIGNDAGDADSIVSALALAFIESTYGNNRIESTPIVSISRESFEKERPEVNLLFELAGVQHVSKELLFLEDLVDMLNTSSSLDFALVDHNTLNTALNPYKKKASVVEILDHHNDEGKYLDTCSGENRTIAFDRGVALVASACTLVAERLKSMFPAENTYPESLATLLLGVILIDSVGLDESIGKVNQRDVDAVNNLIAGTDWKLSEAKSYIIPDLQGGTTVDTSILFNTLQRAKYETSFWDELPVERALSYDYKEFHTSDIEVKANERPKRNFGIASILMPGSEFIAKDGFVSKALEFMHTNRISFLGIMFAFYDGVGDTLKRQLGFCSDQSIDLDKLVEYILSSQADLDLKLVDGFSRNRADEGLQLYLFDQDNVRPSRKQIGPFLEIVYDYYLRSI